MELTEKDFPEWENKDVYLYNIKDNTVHYGKLFLRHNKILHRWYVNQPVHLYMGGHTGGDYPINEDTRLFSESYEAYARQLPYLIDQLSKLDEQSANIEYQKEKINKMKKYAEYVISEYFRKK